MKRASAALLVGLVACSVKDGDGIESSELREIASIQAIRNDSTLPVLVEVGPEQTVEVVCDDNLLPYILTEVSGGVLSPGIEPGFEIVPTVTCEILVTVPSLDWLRNGSIGGIDASGDLAGLGSVINSGRGNLIAVGVDTASLRVLSQGAGRLVLAGIADVAELDSSGGGGIEAGELVCSDANIHNSGSGDVVVTVTDRANVHIEGDGDVVLHGDPEVVETDDDGCGDVY
jgi:hypothetical protein